MGTPFTEGHGTPFAKGHGTANDFVILPDLEGRLRLSEESVRALCDRRTGIGADGILRIVRCAEANDPHAHGADFFMDHRNADGSLAQMCGNGIRVFAAYLVEQGWADPAGMDIATRGGVRHVVRRDDGLYDVDMGSAVLAGRTAGQIDGAPVVHVGTASWPAVAVHVPNPHAVVFVDSLDEAGPLAHSPDISPSGFFPEGANVEFVREIGPAHVAMRVFERGVGETQSCGTGACAVAWASRRRPGAAADPTYRVDVPGGTLYVLEEADGRIHLIGPAMIVAEGMLDPHWLAAAGVL